MPINRQEGPEQIQLVKRHGSGAETRQWGRLKVVGVLCLVAFGSVRGLRAGDPPPTAAAPSEEVLRREAAIAEFTRKMKEANYPALFETAALEFGVPADILKGVAFAETRWEHLTWPPGEIASPETGMPRPYGIMSLWDNDHFGHSLIDAANLIGKDPEELKSDPYQNMRGGAALLKKLYGETPRPEGTAEQDIESWRYAIAKYSGIPESDLNQRHALEVYEFMNKGYHQYGIEWEAHPVNLGPMREEVKRTVAEAARKREARFKDDPNFLAANGPSAGSELGATPVADIPTPVVLPAAQVAAIPALAAAPGADSPVASATASSRRRSILLAFVLLCVSGYAVYRKQRQAPK